jgi:hypothetical protein
MKGSRLVVLAPVVLACGTPEAILPKAPGGQGGRLPPAPLLIAVRQVGWARRPWAAVGPDAGRTPNSPVLLVVGG